MFIQRNGHLVVRDLAHEGARAAIALALAAEHEQDALHVAVPYLPITRHCVR